MVKFKIQSEATVKLSIEQVRGKTVVLRLDDEKHVLKEGDETTYTVEVRSSGGL